MSRNSFPEETGREREDSNQRRWRWCTPHLVIQVEGTASAKVQGLGREKEWIISGEMRSV